MHANQREFWRISLGMTMPFFVFSRCFVLSFLCDIFIVNRTGRYVGTARYG
jgi:hypothetical protein